AIPDLQLSYADPLGGPAPMGLTHHARRALRHRDPGFWLQAIDVAALVIGGGDLLHHGTTVVQQDATIARIDNWAFVEAGLLRAGGAGGRDAPGARVAVRGER